jgi:hypothetical protein
MTCARVRQELVPDYWHCAAIIGAIAALSACSGASFSAGGQATNEAQGGSAGDAIHFGVGAAGTSTAGSGASGGGGDRARGAGNGSGGASSAGRNGQGGEVNDAGSAAAGGEAGVSDVPACPQGSGKDYTLGFYPETQQDITQDVHPFFEVLSLSGDAVALSRIKIRYYYTREAEGSETGSCFWVTGDRCSLVHFAFADLVPSTPTASRMMEVSFSGTKSASLGLEPVEVRTGFTVNHANLKQSNDYSFDPAPSSANAQGAFPYVAWDHVTLYVDDQLVWGTEPCPSQGSMAPASQSPG